MSKSLDVEMGNVYTQTKEAEDRLKATSRREEPTGGIRQTDEHTVHIPLHDPPMDQPTAPLLKNEVHDNKPPLAEAEDLNTPALDKHLGAIEDVFGRPVGDDDEVDGVTNELVGVGNGDAHGHDSEDDPAHYGLESRFGDPIRPMSAMEIEAARSIPDVNVYQQKKNLAQGMMDLALLSANANQLRYVLDWKDGGAYFWMSLVFICLSIIFQIMVGVGLIMNSRFNVKQTDHLHQADRINNLTVIGIFLVTVINVLLPAFKVPDMPRP